VHHTIHSVDECDVFVPAVDTYEVCGVALNRPAYQSSVYSSDNGFYHTANLANDGHYNLTTCAASNIETNPWWMVDLGQYLTITGVSITSGVHFGKHACSVRFGSVSIVRRFDSLKIQLKLKLALTLTLTLTDTGGLRTIEPSDYRADTANSVSVKSQV